MAQGDPWGFLDEHAPTATKTPEGDWSFLDEHEPPDTSGFQITPAGQPEMQAPEAPAAPNVQGAEPGFMQPGVGGIESVPRTGPDRKLGFEEVGPQLVRGIGSYGGRIAEYVGGTAAHVKNLYFPGNLTEVGKKGQEKAAEDPGRRAAETFEGNIAPPTTVLGRTAAQAGPTAAMMASGPLAPALMAATSGMHLKQVYDEAISSGKSPEEANAIMFASAPAELGQAIPILLHIDAMKGVPASVMERAATGAKVAAAGIVGSAGARAWGQTVKNGFSEEQKSVLGAALEGLPEDSLMWPFLEGMGVATHAAGIKGTEGAKVEPGATGEPVEAPARPGEKPPPAVQERPTSGGPAEGSPLAGEASVPREAPTGEPGETTTVELPRRAVERPGQPERRQNTDFRQQLEQADQEAALKALRLHNAGDETGALAVMQEHAKARTEAVAAEHTKARTDAGTGLPNKHAWAERDHEGQTRTSIDLDGLGAINDQYGHEAGNAYLRKAAEVFKEEFPEGEIARTGGDEFEADAPHTAEAEARMQRVQEKLANVTVDLGVHDGERVTKKGIGLSWGHGEDAATADAEMYKHKAARTEAGERRPGKETEQPGITRTREAEAPPAPEPARPAEAAPEAPSEPAPAAEPPKGPEAAKGKPGETFEEQRARYTPFQKEVEAEVQAEIEAGKNAPEPTSTKNAVTAAEREARGVSPIEDHIRRSMPETWRMAEEKAKADPSLGDRIVKGEAVQGLERDVREAVLLREKVGAQNEAERIDKALAEAQASGDEAGVKALSDQADAAEARNTEIDQAAKREGVEWGRSGRIRQMLVARDYSIASLQSKLRAAKGGKALTAEERASAAAHSEKLIALEKRVQEVEAQLREKQTAKAEKAMTPSGKKRLLERLDQAAEEARARLAAKRGRAGGGLPFDPQDIADVARIAASHIAHGIDASVQLVKDFGEAIKPHLEAIMEQAKKLHRETVAQHAEAEGQRLVYHGTPHEFEAFDSSKVGSGQGAQAFGHGLYFTERPEIAERYGQRALEMANEGGGKAVSGKIHETLMKPHDADLLDWNKPLSEQSAKVKDALTKLGLGEKINDPLMTGLRAYDEIGQKNNFSSKEASRVLAENGVRGVKYLEGNVGPKGESGHNYVIFSDKDVALAKTAIKGSPILDYISQKADEARARIKERGPRAMAGLDPADLLDRTIVGAHYLAQDIVKFADWSARMVTELGETIRPHLEDLYAKSKAFLESTKKQVNSEGGAVKRLLTGAKKYRARTEAGDFETPPKPEQLPWSPERAKAKTDFEAAKREFERERARYKFENRTTGQRARDVAREALNLPKQIMTGFDMSATLFQGGIQSATHPIISAKALKESVRALVSERKSLEVDTALRNRPKAAEGEKAGLELTSLDGPLSAHEEHMRSNWAGKLPIIGKGVEASNRAFTTFLNVQRALTFDKLTEAMPDKSPKAQNAIANFINVSTGRGYTPAKFKAAMSAAANVLWSPRLMVSRFQLLAGQPLYRGTASSRMAIAGEYAKALGALGAVYAVSALAGNDVEKDPRSSNFGKIKIGNTYLDPTLGLSQVTTLLTRVGSGETKTQTGKIEPLRTPIFGKGKGPGFGQSTVADVVFRFLRTKFSPTIGIPMDVLSGKNVAGQPVTPGSAAQEALVPLAFQDVYQAMKDRGIPEGAALGLLSIFGAHIQVHDKIKKAG